MITADGERSRRRIPAAKKALDAITMLDLPAKAGIIEGFRYRVWQLEEGELSGGRIVAPMGVYVVLADAGGFKTFVCDSVESAAGPVFDSAVGDRFVRFPSIIAAQPNVSWPILDWAAVRDTQDFVVAPAGPANQDGSAVDGTPYKFPTPVCAPIAGEIVATLLSFFQPRALPIYSKPFSLFQATHCYSNGQSNPSSLPAFGWGAHITNLGFTAGRQASRLILMSSASDLVEVIAWKPAREYSGAYPHFFRYWRYYPATGEVDQADMIGTAALYPGAPADFISRTSLPKAGTVDGIDIDQLGVLWVGLRGIHFLHARPWDPSYLSFPGAYAQLQFTLAFYSPGQGWRTVNYDTLEPQLTALAAGELSWAWKLGSYTEPPAQETLVTTHKWVMAVISGGWPVDRDYSVFDADGNISAMTVTDAALFMDSDGSAYAWLRCCDPAAVQDAAGQYSSAPKLGGIKFSYPDGITRVPLAMPLTVLGDITLHPEILMTQAGVYSCFATKSTGEVIHAYIGSPFGMWEEIPLPAAAMQVIRIFTPGPTAAATGLVGIGKVVIDGAVVHRVFIKVPGTMDWAALSRIPVESVSPQAEWEVCVFGADELPRPLQYQMTIANTDMREL